MEYMFLQRFHEKFCRNFYMRKKKWKNVKIRQMELGIGFAGSTGRQNVHGHRIRVWHAFLHLQLRGFVKI